MIKKRVVFLDLDNTLIRGHSQRLFMCYLLKKGLLSRGLCFRIAFQYFSYELGILDNFKQLREDAFSVLKGISVKKMSVLYDNFFKEVIAPKFRLSMINIINLHKARGDALVLVTASMYDVAERISDSLGLDNIIATELEIEDGLYTGRILKGPIYADEKAKIANKFLQDNHFILYESYCYTDHISDLPLLFLVDNPTAVSPGPALRRIAIRMAWPIMY